MDFLQRKFIDQGLARDRWSDHHLLCLLCVKRLFVCSQDWSYKQLHAHKLIKPIREVGSTAKTPKQKRSRKSMKSKTVVATRNRNASMPDVLGGLDASAIASLHHTPITIAVCLCV